MKCASAAAAVLLSLFSLGLSAPLSSCDDLLKPITISKEEMLGRWDYIGGSSDIPGSRSLAYLMTGVWLDLNVTSKSNVLNIVQTQRIFGTCSSLAYDVIFENSTMLIEQPFYLKEVYLSTECPDCLVAKEDVISATNFTSLLMFSRSRSVSPAALELFKKQAECLQMPTPIMLNSDNEICPDDITPVEGLSALNSVLQAKMGFRVAKFLDSLFDMFIN
ncbi:uncharacterized protein LOC102237293 [Xiphophorus maculatus]|uniref:uncharacterized protein LOC102237293 n=1 Tax=Xiphophorus maculatus TaxID=8083 RepID=UPI0003B5450F|nr:uncharacterized protein LOC102237293 [Xiphophorus maculatus]XP_027872466.1 uncharacterized protein LOC114144141 [Xiphophorus couchianus]